MLYTGDFSPIINGEIDTDTFVTDTGTLLFHFITGFKTETDGQLRFPSLAIVRNRFEKTIDIPDPDPADSVEALAYEVRSERFRSKVSEIAHELSLSAEHSEGLAQTVTTAVAQLKKELEPTQRSNHKSLARDAPQILEDYAEGNILPEGMPWPWPSMTKETRGIRAKEFTVIAGRPKSRKTFTAIAVAAHMVKNANARVLFISPEMPPEQILLRYMATHAGLRYREFKNANLQHAEEIRLVEAVKTYGIGMSEDEDAYSLRLSENLGVHEHSLPSFDVVQGTNQTVSWIESQIEIFKPDLVIADSFYRLKQDGGRKNDADWKVVTAISRQLKDLAMSAGVAIIGTHQLNRDAEGKVGTTGNLALADAVGQDADLILRVVTGKIDDIEQSAILVLDGREVPFDGVMINNQPCVNFSEIGLITSKKQVLELMQDEEDREEEEEAQNRKSRRRKGKKTPHKGAGTSGGLEATSPIDEYDSIEEYEEAMAKKAKKAKDSKVRERLGFKGIENDE